MKKALIIIVIIIVLAAICVGILFFFHQQTVVTTTTTTGTLPTSTNPGGVLSTTTTATPPTTGNSFFLSDAGISQADITPGPPSDAPQGATIPFQTASGTVTLKNFYPSVQGYWPPLDVLLLADGPSYTLWYYRDDSQFEIDVPPDGGLFDEDAGATQLSTMLGVSQQQLCSLPVTVVYMIDGGTDGETSPLDFCTPSGVINPQ
jgi:hypothetical protein